ncbi:MAG: EamA family transporter [Beggiatoa sp. IS2]|nr:MAG: EamA family transporter [Beggiatoa sp. IS2]
MSVPFAYLSVIIIWSTTPLAIQWSCAAGGFLFAVSARMALGAFLCWVLIALLRLEFPWHRTACYSYLAVSVGIYGSMVATYWGAQFIPSGLISVLFGFTPIVTSILAAFWLNERSFTFNKWLGMALGLLGLSLIFWNELQIDRNGMKGLCALLLAVVLHSSSSVWIKRINAPLSALVMTGGGLLITLPLYGLTWFIFGEPFPQTVTTRAGLSIVYLGLFGSVFGLVLYYHVLKHIDASRAALITLITPATALLLGQTLNGEVIHLTVGLGAILILGGLALYQWGQKAG